MQEWFVARRTYAVPKASDATLPARCEVSANFHFFNIVVILIIVFADGERFFHLTSPNPPNLEFVCSPAFLSLRSPVLRLDSLPVTLT